MRRRIASACFVVLIFCAAGCRTSAVQTPPHSSPSSAADSISGERRFFGMGTFAQGIYEVYRNGQVAAYVQVLTSGVEDWAYDPANPVGDGSVIHAIQTFQCPIGWVRVVKSESSPTMCQ
jgi:hypothetical protein